MQAGLFRVLKTIGSAGLFCLLCAGILTFASSTVSAFQEAAAEPAAEPAAAEPAAEPAADAATDDSGSADAAAPAADTAKTESYLMWMINASGVFGFMIIGLSFIMVALVMMCFMQVRRANFLPQEFIDSFEQKLNARDFQGAYESAKNDESLIARVLAAGLSRINQGYEKAVEGMQEIGDDEGMALDHRLSYLSLIGAIAPMLGLLGTVQGMIASFRVIATSATTPKPSELADGISTALFTTLEGLVVAIPAVCCYAWMKNRIARYFMELGVISEGLMGRFAQAGKQAPAPRPAGGAAPAAAPSAPQQ